MDVQGEKCVQRFAEAVVALGAGSSPIEHVKGARTPEVSSSGESRWKVLISPLPSASGESAYVVGDVLATRSRKGSHLSQAEQVDMLVLVTKGRA